MYDVKVVPYKDLEIGEFFTPFDKERQFVGGTYIKINNEDSFSLDTKRICYLAGNPLCKTLYWQIIEKAVDEE